MSAYMFASLPCTKRSSFAVRRAGARERVSVGLLRLAVLAGVVVHDREVQRGVRVPGLIRSAASKARSAFWYCALVVVDDAEHVVDVGERRVLPRRPASGTAPRGRSPSSDSTPRPSASACFRVSSMAASARIARARVVGATPIASARRPGCASRHQSPTTIRPALALARELVARAQRRGRVRRRSRARSPRPPRRGRARPGSATPTIRAPRRGPLARRSSRRRASSAALAARLRVRAPTRGARSASGSRPLNASSRRKSARARPAAARTAARRRTSRRRVQRLIPNASRPT